MFEWTWKIVQWPVAIALIALAFAIVYYVAPAKRQRWKWISPGSLIGAAVWILSSLVFKFYVTNFTDYNAAYGAVGAVIILLLWFYVSGRAILVGAEMNAEIEHASTAAP
jgi:membrane protein